MPERWQTGESMCKATSDVVCLLAGPGARGYEAKWLQPEGPWQPDVVMDSDWILKFRVASIVTLGSGQLTQTLNFSNIDEPSRQSKGAH